MRFANPLLHLADAHRDKMQIRLQRDQDSAVRHAANGGYTGPCREPFVIKLKDEDRLICAPCKKCLACRGRRTRQLVGRALLETETRPVALACTLTYDDEKLPDPASLHADSLKKEAQALKERLRYYFGPCRAHLVTQFGTETGRLHWHALIWPQDQKRAIERDFPATHRKRNIEPPKWWPHGLVNLEPLNAGTAKYAMSYLTRPDKGTVWYRKPQLLGIEAFERWCEKPLFRANQPGPFYSTTGPDGLPRYHPMDLDLRNRALQAGAIEPQDLQPPDPILPGTQEGWKKRLTLEAHEKDWREKYAERERHKSKRFLDPEQFFIMEQIREGSRNGRKSRQAG